MTLKVAIVGCGKIADGHVEEIQKLGEEARVVAVCDLELLMAEQLATRYGVPAHYDDFERMLERERPDVVHVATPPGSHLALSRAAARAGAHVLVEKPVALRHADAVELVSAVEREGRKLTVGWTYLFDPPALELEALLREGAIGEVVHVESVYGYNLSGPFGKALLGDGSHWVHRLPGKLFQNNVDHMLNKIAALLPDERPRIQAASLARRPERFGDARDQMHDELRVQIVGERVTGAGLFSSHARPAQHLLRVHGTRDTVELDFTTRTVTSAQHATLPSAVGRVVPAFGQALAFARAGARNALRFARADFHFFAGLGELLRRFYRSIRDDAPPPIPTRDILRVSWMMDEIFAQLGQGGAS